MRLRYKAGIIITVIIVLIGFSDVVRTSISNSLSLCFHGLIPALFPFFILSGILLDVGIDLLLPAPWASFLVGQICGFPLGTRFVCKLYQHGRIDPHQANTLLMCTANASPAFIVIIVGTTVLHNKNLGYLLFFCQFICSFASFLLFVPNKTKNLSFCCKSTSLLQSLIDNTKNATEQIIFVCGMTTAFGIIYDLLYQLPLHHFPLFRILLSCTELLHGITMFDEQEILYISVSLAISGMCVWMQCIYYIRATDLLPRYLIYGKVLYGICMPMLLILFSFPNIKQKVTALIIIILTNTVTACIIKSKEREKDNDILQNHRKVLRILRTRHKNRNERASSVSP